MMRCVWMHGYILCNDEAPYVLNGKSLCHGHMQRERQLFGPKWDVPREEIDR